MLSDHAHPSMHAPASVAAGYRVCGAVARVAGNHRVPRFEPTAAA